MKVIFLDIDGVLNNANFILQAGQVGAIDPEAVKLLNQITQATGAVLVISSSWRLSYQHNLVGLRQKLQAHGIEAAVIGMTPAEGKTRANQIQAWLKSNPQVSRYLILDDQPLGGLESHWIQTSFETGLQSTQISTAIQYLNQ